MNKLIAGFVVLGFLVSAGTSCTENKQKPNIIYILADDLGYGDLGCYGQADIQTPHIDQMATEGMRFTQHYAGSAVCAPSRCALLTGKHTGHAHIRNNKRLPFEGNEPIPDRDITIVEILKEVGYTTAAIGKWGIGYPGSEGDPNNQGFDLFYGYNCQRQAHSYYPPHLWRNDKKEILDDNLNGEKNVYSHDLLVTEALTFIEQNSDNPFFLYLPFTIPHTNFEVPDLGIYADKDWTENQKTQAAMISRMDSDIGRIFDLLQQLKIDENTLVFFTSDNGAHGQGGTLQHFNASGDLRAKKGMMYEGGLRVPMVVRWPGKIRQGSESEHVSAFWDMMPTLGELVDAPIPEVCDGLSFLPTLLESGKQKEHDYLYWELGNKQALRFENWKAVRPNLNKDNESLELYNLDTDIEEKNDLSKQNPEEVERAKKLLKEARVQPHVNTYRNKNLGDIVAPNLVPNKKGKAANYWCTWYWQNYLIESGKAVTNPDPKTIFTNQAARENINQETIFGEEGMAQVMLPKTRGDYFFVIDHGWQDKRIKENTFFTLIMDTIDFPKYAHLVPKDRIMQMNKDIKALGWRSLGLWVRGNPSESEMRTFVEWSKYAGIEYWKIDGGDTKFYYASRIKNEIYPELTLEHVTGAGPLTPTWGEEDREFYPSVYYPELNPSRSAKMLEILQNTDVFRTYDAAPLLVSTTTLQRVHDILSLTGGDEKYTALLNIQDDCNIAAALGLLVAVKRHPMNTPRMYKGEDYHLQISGDRKVAKRLNEMDRLALWQRIAPPMPAGYGTYQSSEEFLIDSIVFHEQHTWYTPTYGKMVRQSGPAVMSRNIGLPSVATDGEKPYVMASRFENGAVCIATEGRIKPDDSWFHPRAEVAVSDLQQESPIGIFGHYKTLTLVFADEISEKAKVWAQDLLADAAVDISERVEIKGRKLIIPGDLIDEIGTSCNDAGDISVPGLVLRVNRK